MSNSRIKNLNKKLLSDNWYTLHKVSYDFQKKDGLWERQQRESYDRGNGATILLYNKSKGTIILTRQFRLPTYLNGNKTGMLIETCAGLLDNDNPEACIKKETKEETGYQIENVEKIFEAYMSPGSVTELVYFYIGAYTKDMKISKGGGLHEEQEYIEVLELDFQDAYNMIGQGTIKDGKTIMLIQHIKISGLMGR
jgi:nudix-type nucleoside diphosphatase (YffH/AdpP family)